MSTTIEARNWDRGAVAGSRPVAVDSPRRLRQLVALGDVVALLAAAAVVLAIAALLGAADAELAAALVGAAVSGVVAIRTQGLWDGHRSSVRSLELAGLVRAAAVVAASALLLDRLLTLDVPLAAAAGIGVTGLVSLVAWRSGLRMWVATSRAERPLRPAHARRRDRPPRRRARPPRPRSIPRPASSTSASSAVASRPRPPASRHLWVGEIADVAELLDGTSSVDRVVVCSGAVGSVDLAGLLGPEQHGRPRGRRPRRPARHRRQPHHRLGRRQRGAPARRPGHALARRPGRQAGVRHRRRRRPAARRRPGARPRRHPRQA